MATLNLGRLKPVFRSTWNSSTAYNVDDIVVRNNQSYISIQAGTNQDPATATAYWTLMAAKGTDGTDVGATLTTQGDILYRDASGLQRLAAGTNGQALLTGGAGANPSWGDVAGIISTAQIDKDTSSGNQSRVTTTSATFSDILGSNNHLVITPASTSSKFLLNVSFVALGQSNSMYNSIFRKIGSGSFTDIVSDSNNRGLGGLHPTSSWTGCAASFIDAPNTTSQVTYALYSRLNSASGTGYITDNGGEMFIFNAMEF